ncbi:RICIN domain-containing protein [Longispora urticae]
MLKRILMTLAAAAVAFVTLAPSAAQADVWWLQYSNKATGLCIDVKDRSTGNGAIVQEFGCKVPNSSGSGNQQFTFQSSGAGVQIVAQHSGKCLDLANWSTADGGTVQQWACSGGANQQWKVQYHSANPNGTTNYMIKNVNSGKCLNHSNSGTALYQLTCNSASTQQVWKEHFRESSCTTCLTATREH